MQRFRRHILVLAALATVAASAEVIYADSIKDALDAAKQSYESSQQKAKDALLGAFDSQIKILSQGGDIDAVESLLKEKKTFSDSKSLPHAPSMRAAVGIFQASEQSNGAQLKAAYETAIADYTKAQRFDDAVLMKRLTAERFDATSTQPSAGGNPAVASSSDTVTASSTQPQTLPADPIRDALISAKNEFKSTVDKAHTALLSEIERKANEAADSGKLDDFKRYNALESTVLEEITVPSDFQDPVIKSAQSQDLSARLRQHSPPLGSRTKMHFEITPMRDESQKQMQFRSR